VNNVAIDQLEIIMERRLAALPGILRPYTALPKELPRGLVLTGQRGVGKTTFLLHHLREKNFLYLSADNPLLATFPLDDTVHDIYMRGYDGVAIDEVHYARTSRSLFPGSWTRTSRSHPLIDEDRAVGLFERDVERLGRAVKKLEQEGRNVAAD
jgi:hypothetical protein